MEIVDGILKKVNEEDIIDNTLIIPEGVTKIEDNIELFDMDLKKVILPKTMKIIGSYAFSACNQLTKIEMNEGLETIKKGAFYHCESLKEIKLPDTLKKIEEAAFCEDRFDSIIIPKGVKKIGTQAFYNCFNLTKVVLENGIIIIEDEAFEYCANLTEISLPNTLQKIGNRVFRECWRLKTISLPESLESIGEFSFESSGITEIEIPKLVQEIKNGTFKLCIALEKITIKGNITKIKGEAFSHTQIKRIDLPNSLCEIESDAFCSCKGLNQITLPENIEVIEPYVFKECTSLTKVVLPKGLKTIGEKAFCDCNKLYEINFPEGLTKIEKNAFEKCESIEKVIFPKSLEIIEKYAFYSCPNITIIEMKDNIKTIEFNAFRKDATSIIEKLITPWGTYQFKIQEFKDITKYYLYLYANHLLKDKYENITDFLENEYIMEAILGGETVVYFPNGIQKFKNLFSKLRKEYDVASIILFFLEEKTTEEFSYSVWNQIKGVVNQDLSYEKAEAICEMIEIFGLFHKNQNQKKRINQFSKLFSCSSFTITKLEYENLLEELKNSPNFSEKDVLDYFDKKKIEIFKKNSYFSVPEEFEIYLNNGKILTIEERKKIKKLTGAYGKRLNDYINENYEKKIIEVYSLNEHASNYPIVKEKLLQKNILLGSLNDINLHNIFDGCEKEYNEDFYNFLMDNLPFILKNNALQYDVKNIQKKFEAIRNFYLRNAGSNEITLKQALDYLKEIPISYHKGNYELAQLTVKSGVTDQNTFNYYQDIYEKNRIRKYHSLIRRKNTYEIDGFTIQAELLRKDDPFSLLVGEKNYTNCCQRYHGIGHNCMAHATCSPDGGIFVTRLYQDGEWILLTESWDWQNNNLYCHDNIEGTKFLINAPNSLKEAVKKVFRLDAEFIIEQSKSKIEDYISRRRKKERLSLSERQLELKKLEKIERNQVIKVVTVGTRYNDLDLENSPYHKIEINESFFVGDKQYSLSNFQPVNYNASKPYFDNTFTSYSDAKGNQYILAGSIEDISLENEELEPIYKDERRIIEEQGESIRDYTRAKISRIENQAYSEPLRENHIDNNSTVYLGEDWYLVFEKREDHSIYISDLARINPTLEDEKGLQQDEIISTVKRLINDNDYIEADLKEDTSYILYLMNKRLGYIEQIGEDFSYLYGEEEQTRLVTKEEQEEILKARKQLKEKNKQKCIMHKIAFKKRENT